MRKVYLLLLICISMFAADKPNILWIVAEDMSPVLGCYGDKAAITPNIDKLAKESILYQNAYSTATVCSPARACLINGLIAVSQGTQHLRSTFPIPEYMTGFPAVLKNNGYYTTNNVKTDYNSGLWQKIISASWHENSSKADWTGRQKGQAFFSIYNLMVSHQTRSMVWPYDKFKKDVQSKLTSEEIHNPDKMSLPPFYVDTPIVRRDWARFYDCVTVMDKQVGNILKKLEDDGLADETIVFFYSDHGTGMPRFKRALLDTGIKVPLLIRFPEKYKHLAPGEPGTTSNRLVSFEDFGPTILSLTENKIPAYMEGKAFLGKVAAKEREYAFAHRDRVADAVDLSRAIHDKQFIYVRHFMPHLSYHQPSGWPDQGQIRQEFFRLTNKAKMSPAQWHYVKPEKAIEELYDTINDPLNLTNLADNPKYKAVLERLRKALFETIAKKKDFGFVPEAMAWEWTKGTTPYDFVRNNKDYDQAAIVNAARQVGLAGEADFLKNLNSDNAAVRYWGALGLSASKNLSPNAVTALSKALKDQQANVRIEAANALLRHGQNPDADLTLITALSLKNMAAVLHAARTIELLGLPSFKTAIKACVDRMESIHGEATSITPGNMDMSMFIKFSNKAYLNKL